MVKARDRYVKAMKAFPDQAEMYKQRIDELNEQIIQSGVCRRCGRPLKDGDARDIGYGKDCLAKAEAAASEESDG